MTTCTETSQIKNLECTKRIQYLTGQTNCLRNEFKKKIIFQKNEYATNGCPLFVRYKYDTLSQSSVHYFRHSGGREKVTLSHSVLIYDL